MTQGYDVVTSGYDCGARPYLQSVSPGVSRVLTSVIMGTLCGWIALEAVAVWVARILVC